MKNLDLNVLGVQEMDAEEMRQIEGGNLYKTVVKFLEVVGVLAVAEAFVEGFNEGFKEGYSNQQSKK